VTGLLHLEDGAGGSWSSIRVLLDTITPGPDLDVRLLDVILR